MNINIFNKYWIILKRNYCDKTHNEEDFKVYYSIFKKCSKEDFVKAIENVLKYQSYFPRVDEIVRYLPHNTNAKWLEKELDTIKPDDDEINEMNEILKKIEED